MKLSELFAGVDARVPAQAGQVEVRALSVDSRKVPQGALFAALPGASLDGAAFTQQAIASGASAILAGRALETAPVPCVVSANPRRAFSLAAARFHGQPSRSLQLVGVTGTNGKTTTAYLIEQLCAARGVPAGLIGTVEARWPGGQERATHTTPESHELQAMLARMVTAGVKVAAIEVSSHALTQERVAGCTFAGAAFTNLTRDHLDYHGTMDGYFNAKARLFRELLPASAPAVLNFDDARCAGLAQELRRARDPRALGFTTRGAPAAALSAEGLTSTLSGLRFTLRLGPPFEPKTLEIESPLIGAHNAENLLAALGLLLGLGVPAEALGQVTKFAAGAPGRLERVPEPDSSNVSSLDRSHASSPSSAGGRIVLVDYAHSDDALARALDAIRTAAGPSPRLACVFGCGGDRDKGKRPLMGAVAAGRADLTIATSDNPRTEDPLQILAEVEAGLAASGKPRLDPESAARGAAGYCVVPDRRAAIALAIRQARRGDAVLIAGKGHEDYQIVGAEKRPFDDREEARRALREQGARA